MRRSARKQKSFLKAYILGGLVILISIILLVLKLGFFNIKDIEVLGYNLVCTDRVQLKDYINVQGKNLLFLDTKDLQTRILQKFVCVRNVNISQNFPDKIKVEVVGRIPAAIVLRLKDFQATTSAFLEEIATPSAEVSTDVYLVDQEGIVFSKALDKPDIPNIFLDGNIELGKKLDGNTGGDIFKILNKVKEFGLDNKVIASSVLDNFLIIFSLPKIIFNLNEDINTQIASLQLILEKAKIDDASLEFIDLRFDKPTVKFAPKQNVER